MWTQFDREANFLSSFFSLAWRLECAYSMASLKKVPIQGKFEKFNEMEWSDEVGCRVGARAL